MPGWIAAVVHALPMVQSIHPIQSNGGLENIPAVIGREAAYTLDSSLAHHRANTERQTAIHIPTYHEFWLIKYSFEFLEECRGHGENPQEERSNSTQRGPGRPVDSNPWLPRCELKLLTSLPGPMAYLRFLNFAIKRYQQLWYWWHP